MFDWLYNDIPKENMGNKGENQQLPDQNFQYPIILNWLNIWYQYPYPIRNRSDPKYVFQYPIHTRPEVKKTLPVRPWPAAAKPAVGKSAAAKADYIRPMQTMAHKGPLISAVLPATPIYCVPMKPYLRTLHFLYFHIWYFILFFSISLLCLLET